MKTRENVVIDKLSSITRLNSVAVNVDGEVIATKGVHRVDVKSLLGLISIYPATPFTITYPEAAVEFEAVLNEVAE